MDRFELVDDHGVVQGSYDADRPEYKRIHEVEYVYFYRWNNGESKKEYVAGPIQKPTGWAVRVAQ
jgi:hypothetical protein